jgi:hypothetical protein
MPENENEHNLEINLKLLKQRSKWIRTDLFFYRAIEPVGLPPLRGLEPDDFLEPSDKLEGRLVRMLDRLNDAITQVQAKLDMQKCPFPLPEI